MAKDPPENPPTPLTGPQKRNLPADPERGARIRQLMDARGLTEKRLAEMLGVHDRTVQHWKAGAAMRREKAVQLAGALGIPPGELVGEHGAPLSADEKLAALRAEALGDRRQAGMRADFQAVARLIDAEGDELRGEITGLREDVQALASEMQSLNRSVQALRRQQRDQAQSDKTGSQREGRRGRGSRE